jgi:hypothetical protein
MIKYPRIQCARHCTRFSDSFRSHYCAIRLTCFASLISTYVSPDQVDIVSHATHDLGHLGDLQNPLGNLPMVPPLRLHLQHLLATSPLLRFSISAPNNPERTAVYNAKHLSPKDLRLTCLVCIKLRWRPRSQVHGTER